ncbi:hypothetical protein BS78_05G261200 [Paspalum vaginatum]|nr:hypothetical protein BS78_05G261200 [Paspalum vaginatum]
MLPPLFLLPPPRQVRADAPVTPSSAPPPLLWLALTGSGPAPTGFVRRTSNTRDCGRRRSRHRRQGQQPGSTTPMLGSASSCRSSSSSQPRSSALVQVDAAVAGPRPAALSPRQGGAAMIV